MTSKYGSFIFTVVIPLIPQHDVELKRIFKTLSFEQHLIKRVIICRSETKAPKSKLLKKYLRYAKAVGFFSEIIVSTVKDIARDGTNRNRGWEIADTEFVAFLDADDLYVENRLTRLLTVFSSTNADAILHDYNSAGILAEFEIKKEAEPTRAEVKERNASSGECFLANQFGHELKIHMAHMTVRNNIKESLTYSNKFPGADIEFAINLAKKGFDIRYLPIELSAWNRKRSPRYKIRLYRMGIIKKLNMFMKIKN